MTRVRTRFLLRQGFDTFKKNSPTKPPRILKDMINEVNLTFENLKKSHDKTLKKLDILEKQKADKDQLSILEKSLDKQMAGTIYNDMQMYVDEVMNNFYGRFAFEFKKHKSDVSRLLSSEKFEPLSRSPEPKKPTSDENNLKQNEDEEENYSNPVSPKMAEIKEMQMLLDKKIVDEENSNLNVVESMLSMFLQQYENFEAEIKAFKKAREKEDGHIPTVMNRPKHPYSASAINRKIRTQQQPRGFMKNRSRTK